MVNNPSYQPKPLVAKFGTNSVANQPVTVLNKTTGDIINKDENGNQLKLDSAKQVIIDCANFLNGWKVGDVIEFKTVGKAYGSDTVTLTATNQAVKSVSDTATAATLPIINL